MKHCLQENEPRLSSDILNKVLSFVERQQRIGSCSLVCRAWRSAAAAATPDISINLPVQDTTTQMDLRCSSLEAWLTQHGNQVHSLQLNCTDIAGWSLGMCDPSCMGRTPMPTVYVPCQQLAQLQRLCVENAQLQPSITAAAGDYSGSSSSAALGRVTRSSTTRSIKHGVPLRAAFLIGLSSLTMLQLTECSLAGWAPELAALSALTQLQHLQLKHMRRADRRDELDGLDGLDELDGSNIIDELKSVDRAAAACAREFSDQLRAALPHMTALTYLNIKHYGMTAAVLQGLSRLQQLRELRVKHIKKDSQTSRVSNQAVARLPASLSLLHISVWCGLKTQVVLNSRSISTLQQLSNLQHLALPGVQLQDVTGFMEAVSQVTSLSLEW
jgi:hypothetical protein